ncbi:hypothetical protein GCM10010394_46450 [Streptomyces crystallinus]|uniref:Uncharacterized protein n=1 Tax=Streptomyces crystallinus TaxID=68191 RepID=A0ABN1GH06_9ACTN
MTLQVIRSAERRCSGGPEAYVIALYTQSRSDLRAIGAGGFACRRRRERRSRDAEAVCGRVRVAIQQVRCPCRVRDDDSSLCWIPDPLV